MRVGDKKHENVTQSGRSRRSKYHPVCLLVVDIRPHFAEKWLLFDHHASRTRVTGTMPSRAFHTASLLPGRSGGQRWRLSSAL